MNLGALIEGLPAAIAHGNPQVEVTGVTKDSRAVKPGKVGGVPRGWRILSVKACPTALRGR